METINVLALIGGISSHSLNQKCYQAMEKLKPNTFKLQTFALETLPFFSQDLENDPPDVVTEFKEMIREADALLIVTPEYNRSFPGVLKNALDWGSRPYGQNLWNEKPAAVMGASIGNTGTFGAQHHLRQVLAYLNVSVMGQPEFYWNASKSFGTDGEISDPKTKEIMMKYWAAFETFVERFLEGKLAHNKVSDEVPLARSQPH